VAPPSAQVAGIPWRPPGLPGSAGALVDVVVNAAAIRVGRGGLGGAGRLSAAEDPADPDGALDVLLRFVDTGAHACPDEPGIRTDVKVLRQKPAQTPPRVETPVGPVTESVGVELLTADVRGPAVGTNFSVALLTATRQGRDRRQELYGDERPERYFPCGLLSSLRPGLGE